jgi:hypothetical protein
MFLFGKYWPHIKRTFLFLGIPLFVAILMVFTVVVGLRGDEKELLPSGEQVDLNLPTQLFGMTLMVVRFALPVIAAFVAVPLIVSNLFQKIYAIRGQEEAHNALNRTIFGKLGSRPVIKVGEGQVLVGAGSVAHRVGGPATLVVYEDNAVVTEQYGCIKRVLGPGKHSLGRFEKVWEIIDLQPQHWVYPVFALTKEGIPVHCEIDLSFQIDDRPGEWRWPVHSKGLYAYSEEAVFRAATSVWIREPDHPEHKRTWAGRVVIGFAEGLLRNTLAEYRLDWLLSSTQPGQKPPREQIRERVESGLRGGVGKVGAKIIRVDIGPIEVKARDEEITEKLQKIIPKQRAEAWYADWEARTFAGRAEMEAALLRTDMARIQAQAEVIIEIMESLQDIIATQGVAEPYILAVRLVESLRWMSYNVYQHDFMPPESVQRLRRLQDVLKGLDKGEAAGSEKAEKAS